MQILAFDSSALTASVALFRDGSVLSEISSTNGLNHSVRLLPMIDEVLTLSDTTLEETDAFAVSAGPGSFTGVRIGISTLKGLAFGTEKPCAPVSTLEALAFGECGAAGVVCPLMDARRGEFYNALFYAAADGTLERLTEDRAIGAEALIEELRARGERVFICGDGQHPFVSRFGEQIRELDLHLALPTRRVQRAAAVACVGARMLSEGQGVNVQELAPLYLRASGAERKREKRLS